MTNLDQVRSENNMCNVKKHEDQIVLIAALNTNTLVKAKLGRSEGFPNGTFDPCTLWDRAQARLENCRPDAVGVRVIWKFRMTCRTGKYIWRICYGVGLQVRDVGEWRPGFYTESRRAYHEHCLFVFVN